MKDKDFRPGDPVTFVVGSDKTIKTFVKEIRPNQVNPYQVVTEHGESFTKDGRYHCDVIYPSLFHGHNVTVKIEGEETPRRTVKRWVNIRFLKHKSFMLSRYYTSERDALEWATYDEETYHHVFAAKAVEIEIPEGEYNE